MRSLAISMALMMGSTALASSELQLESNMPVVLVLDGESSGTVQPIDALLVDIEPGVHNLQIRGMLGKTLYDRDLIFDDDTRTELVWQRKELRLGAVVKLDPNRPPDPEGEGDLGYDSAERIADADPSEAPQPPPVDDEHPDEVAVATPPPTADAPVDPFERPALKRPTAPTPPATPAAQAPPAPAPTAPPVVNAPPVTRDVVAPTAGPRTGGSVVIEAQPGMDLQITHGSQQLRITVENGELVVEDANGTEIHFPANGDAW